MSYFTPDEAQHKVCPIDGASATATVSCYSVDCMMWRWRPLQASDPAYLAAVKAAQKEHGKDAAKYVNEHLAELGLPTEPTHGFCGLAGEPKA